MLNKMQEDVIAAAEEMMSEEGPRYALNADDEIDVVYR
jgi:hypothetical protein